MLMFILYDSQISQILYHIVTKYTLLAGAKYSKCPDGYEVAKADCQAAANAVSRDMNIINRDYLGRTYWGVVQMKPHAGVSYGMRLTLTIKNVEPEYYQITDTLFVSLKSTSFLMEQILKNVQMVPRFRKRTV